MSLRRRLLLTLCLVIGFSIHVDAANAGPFMEGIVESVFKTAEKEFLDGLSRRAPPTPKKSDRHDADSAPTVVPPTAAPTAGPKRIERRAPPVFRLFRNR